MLQTLLSLTWLSSECLLSWVVAVCLSIQVSRAFTQPNSALKVVHALL
jgi:hypothetical protein